MARLARFVRVASNPMKINGKVVEQGKTFVAEFDKINGLPGMQFVSFELDENVDPVEATLNKIKEQGRIVDDHTYEINVTEDADVYDKDPDDHSGEPFFEYDILVELKSKTPREWMSVKKAKLKQIMDDANIDYSQVKDDRMTLYKFLVDILSRIPDPSEET